MSFVTKSCPLWGQGNQAGGLVGRADKLPSQLMLGSLGAGVLEPRAPRKGSSPTAPRSWRRSHPGSHPRSAWQPQEVFNSLRRWGSQSQGTKMQRRAGRCRTCPAGTLPCTACPPVPLHGVRTQHCTHWSERQAAQTGPSPAVRPPEDWGKVCLPPSALKTPPAALPTKARPLGLLPALRPALNPTAGCLDLPVPATATPPIPGHARLGLPALHRP